MRPKSAMQDSIEFPPAIESAQRCSVNSASNISGFCQILHASSFVV